MRIGEEECWMSLDKISSQRHRKARPCMANPENEQHLAASDAAHAPVTALATLAPIGRESSATPHAPRLIPALPDGAFVAKPEEIDRFVVRVLPDGSLYFKGSRSRIDDFIAACNQVGLELHISHVALCG